MSTPDGFSDNPLCAEMERRCSDMLLVSQAVVTCADIFEQACEPRAPKPEWFGTGPGQWPAWQLLDASGRVLVHRLVFGKPAFMQNGIGIISNPSGQFHPCMTSKDMVLPITEDGPTIPVGWKVVGE